MAASSHFTWSISGQVKKFTPPSEDWQRKTGRKLNIGVERFLRYGRDKYLYQDSTPKQTIPIVPDGNCFFRAISMLITGVEDNHMAVREALTKHVADHSDIYRTFLESRGGMNTYVQSMRRSREWATDTEIFAAATLLNTIFEVCTECRTNNGREYHWQTFNPLKDNSVSLPKVYISHKDDHFEPILDIENSR